MHRLLDEQVELLMQGTQFGDAATRHVMEHELRERLATGQPLRVYLGVDPTAPDLHLGHTVAMRKLAQFQQLGHDCIFLIGDFTARIGDPSDKDKTRPQLTSQQVCANVETYTAQAFKLLDPQRTTVRYNSAWHNSLSFADVIRLASRFTVAQFLERDNFSGRFARGDVIYLHEFLYALMQGYDAVVLEADVQLGGTDQTFNILAGRRLQEAWDQKPQVMLTNPMLPGTDGHLKMSKSLGNAIPIDTTPEDMYGKLMSIPDAAMRLFMELLTTLLPAEIRNIFTELDAGQRHPRDVKMLLARQVTTVFHGAARAAQAEAHFVKIFQQRETPPEMPRYVVDAPINIIDLIVTLGLAPSKSAARRLLQQGGVRLNHDRLTDSNLCLEPATETRVLRVGRRHFVELVPAELRAS